MKLFHYKGTMPCREYQFEIVIIQVFFMQLKQIRFDCEL